MMSGSATPEDPYNFKAETTIPVEGHTPDLQPNQTQGTFVDDFLHRPIDAVQRLTMDLKIHLGVASFVCGLCFIIWHYTTLSPIFYIWWWIFPFFFFGLTLTGHFYYKAGDLMFRGVVVLVIEVNLMLFVTDGLTQLGGFPRWFFYVWGSTAAIGVFIYYFKFNTQEPRVTMVFYEYVIINVVLFLAWLSTDWPRPFPWFLIPACLLAIPTVIFYMRDVYGESRWWLYVIVTLIFLNLMCFFIWGFTTVPWPWFLLVFFPSGAIIGFLFFRYRNDDYSVVRVGPSDVQTGSFPAASPPPMAKTGEYDNL